MGRWGLVANPGASHGAGDGDDASSDADDDAHVNLGDDSDAEVAFAALGTDLRTPCADIVFDDHEPQGPGPSTSSHAGHVDLGSVNDDLLEVTHEHKRRI